MHFGDRAMPKTLRYEHYRGYDVIAAGESCEILRGKCQVARFTRDYLHMGIPAALVLALLIDEAEERIDANEGSWPKYQNVLIGSNRCDYRLRMDRARATHKLDGNGGYLTSVELANKAAASDHNAVDAESDGEVENITHEALSPKLH
jgi:hypothetical protein